MNINDTYIYLRDLDKYIDYFEQLFGEFWIKKIVKSSKSTVNPNFWYQYIKAYKKWIKNGSNLTAIERNPKLMEFTTHIKSIQLYEKDWKRQDIKKEILGRLRDNKKVATILFEFFAGIHFLRQGLDVHWLSSIGQEKASDLEIRIGPTERVLLECTIREPFTMRVFSEQILVDHLLNSASRKLQSRYDFGSPRLVIVKIPESIDWSSIKIMKDIDIGIDKWRGVARLKYVNAIYFMGWAPLLAQKTAGGKPLGYYETDQMTYIIRNPDAMYKLPSGLKLVHSL
jgi:hypothetical protein